MCLIWSLNVLKTKFRLMIWILNRFALVFFYSLLFTLSTAKRKEIHNKHIPTANSRRHMQVEHLHLQPSAVLVFTVLLYRIQKYGTKCHYANFRSMHQAYFHKKQNCWFAQQVALSNLKYDNGNDWFHISFQRLLTVWLWVRLILTLLHTQKCGICSMSRVHWHALFCSFCHTTNMWHLSLNKQVS